MQPNWFLALRVPAEGWFEERVTSPPAGLRLFHPEDLHLTVAFLGPCGETRARRAWELTDDWSLGPTQVTLTELVPMGNPRHFSALSFLLGRGREETEREIELRREGWLSAAQARLGHRPAKAHVTIARPPRRAPPEERREALRWAATIDPGPVELVLDELALYTWSEDRKQRQFERVERRRLNP